MNSLPIYHVDAFTSHVFSGNPAAVCPLETWIEDSKMQAIAQENNLSETAFFVPEGDGYRIRWFTPTAEVDLCGHATLATAYVLFECLDEPGKKITFNSRSGELTVAKKDDLFSMDFPSQPPEPCDPPEALRAGLNMAPTEILSSEDYFLVFSKEEEIKALRPDMAKLETLDLRGVIVTSKGEDADFVSRFFAPKYGIKEDPVTGSSHCALIPFWAKKMGKRELHARQLSERGGEIFCEDRGDRVVIGGRAVKFMEGRITI